MKKDNKFINGIKSFFASIKKGFVDFIENFKNGDKITKTSYFIMGYGCLRRKQIGRDFLIY